MISTPCPENERIRLLEWEHFLNGNFVFQLSILKGYVSFEVGKFLLVISVFTDRQLKCRTVTLLDAKMPTPMQSASVEGKGFTFMCRHLQRH